MARREAFHGQGRKVHLGPADGYRQRQASRQSAQALVQQCRGGDEQRGLQVTLRLKQPQPWLLTLLASGWSPIYPCHVPAREIRQKPVGTGPFKFVEFKPIEYSKLAKNPGYWKPGRPYLDGVEFTILR